MGVSKHEHHTNMILPTIHRNGTSAKDLQQGYDTAADALYALEQALNKIEFNARDYYVQHDLAWTQANAERQAINAKVKDVSAYLQEIREHLYA